MSMHFNAGDKVLIVADPPRFEDDPGIRPEMEKYFGKVVTISEKKCPGLWGIQEDSNKWSWDERWLVYPQGNNGLITISFDPSDKSAAHLMVEEAIKNYYAPDNWTEEEIEQAKNLVCEMAKDVIRDGGNLFFSREEEDNSIACSIYRDSFDWDFADVFLAKPHGKDIYNVWIGKCVALCKALKKPIPDFIHYKNT